MPGSREWTRLASEKHEYVLVALLSHPMTQRLPRIQRSIREGFRGCTLIVVSHRLSTVLIYILIIPWSPWPILTLALQTVVAGYVIAQS